MIEEWIDFNGLSTPLDLFYAKEIAFIVYLYFCIIVQLFLKIFWQWISLNTNNFYKKSLWLRDQTQTGTSTPDLSGLGSISNDRVFQTSQSFKTWTSP